MCLYLELAFDRLLEWKGVRTFESDLDMIEFGVSFCLYVDLALDFVECSV
jgi:hypothetical protein